MRERGNARAVLVALVLGIAALVWAAMDVFRAGHPMP